MCLNTVTTVQSDTNEDKSASSLRKETNQFCEGFFSECINNCMRKKLSPLQQWLNENGLSEELFTVLPLLQVQAWKAAHQLLTHHYHALKPQQVQQLRIYIENIHNCRLRKGITDTQTYAVLNISKKLNRQLFKRYRTIHKQDTASHRHTQATQSR